MFGGFKKTTLLGSLGLAVVFASFTLRQDNSSKEQFYLSDDDTVWGIYEKLGKIKMNTVNTSIEGVSAEKGRDIIYNGSSAKQDGNGRTSNQSPYFKCTACHNVGRELNDLADISSEKRLEYAVENDLPFLQGTTFHGIVNRKTFYNDGYQKKYGHVPIIKASNTDIRQAIQLCATQCAQGRELEDWEIESVLAFYWTLELKVKDLNLDADGKKAIEDALTTDKSYAKAIHTIEDHFLDKSPATFDEEDKKHTVTEAEKKDVKRFKNGKAIYERSCLHCHEGRRYSFFDLDNSRFSFKNLLSRSHKSGNGSLHHVARHGTYPLAGKRAYMPLYPLEKMSKSQLVDLQVYIENMAAGNDLTK